MSASQALEAKAANIGVYLALYAPRAGCAPHHGSNAGSQYGKWRELPQVLLESVEFITKRAIIITDTGLISQGTGCTRPYATEQGIQIAAAGSYRRMSAHHTYGPIHPGQLRNAVCSHAHAHGARIAKFADGVLGGD